MSLGPDPERTKALILRICLVLWLLGCIAMGVLAFVRHPQGPWASWQAAAARATAAHQAQLQAQANLDYSTWQQARCGPESGWLERADGARVCTDKRGRRTGQLLAGANP